MTMHLMQAGVLGLAGLVGGYWLPALANRLAERKAAQKGGPLPEDNRYTGLPIRAGAALFAMAGGALSGLFTGSAPGAALLALLWAETFPLAVVDLRIHVVPNELVLMMAGLGVLLQLALFGPLRLLSALAAVAALLAIFLLLMGLLGSGTVGAGDIKLAGAMGLALGYPHVLYALVGMGAALAVYCAAGFAAKKLTLRSFLPFAPFLMAGMAAALAMMAVGL